MALVRSLEKVDASERYKLHDEVEANYVVFEREGKTLMQINTHGRQARQNPGRRTQNFQVDKEGAEALVHALRKTFNL